MSFILHTNVAIHLRDGEPNATKNVLALDGPICISVVTLVELEGGVYIDKAQAPTRRMRLDRMLATIPSLAFDDAAATEYGRIVASQGFSRRMVLDRMIAAHAIARSATLVTLNQRDFADVPGLSLLAW